MIQNKQNWPFKVGLFLFVSIWLVLTFSEFTLNIFNRHLGALIVIEDIPQVWGLGLRTAAGVVSVITILFFLAKRDLSTVETRMALRIVLILEAAYFLSFLPAGFIGIAYPVRSMSQLSRVFTQILPCFVESIIIPAVLVKLFFELNPQKPVKNAIKWALISGTAYLFVFWLNNAGIWIGTVITKGIEYILDYPLNMFSFLVTTVGLLLLTLYTAQLSRKTAGENSLSKVNLKKIGIIILTVGLYLNGILLLWLFFGSVGGWSSWYSWFLGHGYVGRWVLALPLVGLPLIFGAYLTDPNAKLNIGRIAQLSKKQINTFLYSVEAVGAVFFSIIALAYILPIPTTAVYIGAPIFKPTLTVLGTIFFVLVLVGLVLLLLIKQEKNDVALNKGAIEKNLE
jgi:hypothetical protein